MSVENEFVMSKFASSADLRKAMIDEITSLRERLAETEKLAESRLEQMQEDRRQALVWRDGLEKARDEERERCAKICDLAVEQGEITKSALSSAEMLEKLASGAAIFQAKKLARIIRETPT